MYCVLFVEVLSDILCGRDGGRDGSVVGKQWVGPEFESL